MPRQADPLTKGVSNPKWTRFHICHLRCASGSFEGAEACGSSKKCSPRASGGEGRRTNAAVKPLALCGAPLVSGSVRKQKTTDLVREVVGTRILDLQPPWAHAVCGLLVLQYDSRAFPPWAKVFCAAVCNKSGICDQ